jgi:hypothetical protein
MDGLLLPRDEREYTVAQRGGETAARTLKRVREHDPDFDNPYVRAGLLTALRRDGWKVIRGDDGSTLYELPDETTDRSSEQPDCARNLRQQVDGWLEEFGEPIFSTDESGFSDSVKRRLSDLGYVVE